LRQHSSKSASRIATARTAPTTIPAIVLPGNVVCEGDSAIKAAAADVEDSVGAVRDVAIVVGLGSTDAVLLTLMLNI